MKKSVNIGLCLIPLVFGFLFASAMFYLAVNVTEYSREHYQAKMREKKINFNVLRNDGTTKTRPKPGKTWRETIEDYEFQILVIALPLLVFGLGLASITVGTLPERNPLGLSDLMRRGVLAMACLMVISPAILLLYIWTLRIGLIG